MKETTIETLKFDQKNANKHSEFGTGLLNKSLRSNGAGRSILISDDNVIIAGNGLVEQAAEIGLDKVIVVETTGEQIVAVKRKDIKSNTKEFYNMALADNVVAQKNIVMDAEVVEAIVEEHKAVKEWAKIVTDKEVPRSDPEKEKRPRATFFSFSNLNKKLKTNKIEYFSLFRSREMDLEVLKSDKANVGPFVFPVYQFILRNKIKNIILAPRGARSEKNGFHFLTEVMKQVNSLVDVIVVSPFENKKNIIELKKEYKDKDLKNYWLFDDIITRGNTAKKIKTLTGIKNIMVIICNH